MLVFPAAVRVAYGLTHAARCDLPVPKVRAVGHGPGMLLENLGDAAREPVLAEAAAAAVATHAIPPPAGIPTLDSSTLAELPHRSLGSLACLHNCGRWSDVDDIDNGLRQLEAIAARRAQDAELAPFGLCHSEFHPTSLHVDSGGRWRLLDFARAFTGPGLLDLVSWQGTTRAPDLAALHRLLEAYVAAGGPTKATATRGGLPVERWAFGWHRLWIIEWYLRQSIIWFTDPAVDVTYQRVIRRHVGEALRCLTAPAS